MRYFFAAACAPSPLRVSRKETTSMYSRAVRVWPSVAGITPGGKPATVPIPAGFRILAMMYSGGLDPGDLGEVGPDGRGAHGPGLVAGDASALAREDRQAGLGVAGELQLRHLSAPARGDRPGVLRDVIELHARRPPKGFQEGRERPDLGTIEPDRKPVHLRHDVGVAFHEIGAGIQQGLDNVRRPAHPRLPLGGPGADPSEVGSPRPLLADLVADLARPLPLEDLLTGLDELLRGYIPPFEGKLLGRLGLDLRDRVGVVAV